MVKGSVWLVLVAFGVASCASPAPQTRGTETPPLKAADEPAPKAEDKQPLAEKAPVERIEPKLVAHAVAEAAACVAALAGKLAPEAPTWVLECDQVLWREGAGPADPIVLLDADSIAALNALFDSDTCGNDGFEARVMIAGFGRFSTRCRHARTGLNPATGEHLKIGAKQYVHFKPGKMLRERLAE